MSQVQETNVPAESVLHATLTDADFYDAYEAPLTDASLTPTEIFLRATRATPPWVSHLMSVRNIIVKQFGLKDVGGMGGGTHRPAPAYEIGDRLGIFSVVGKFENELLLGIDDSHLDVRVSVLKRGANGMQSYVVSTVVKVHNMLGRIYMAPVGQVHPLVVRAMMRRASV
jgi:Protein of unknown function (DUF2867)